ncbi:MAG: D-glycerate dehydrogenase [Actinobacteria bacterium]|nr:D-glycerate dehydrogenase [Actinomycetota bacterium]
MGAGNLPLLFLTRRIPEPGPTLLRGSFTVCGGDEDRDLTGADLLDGVRGAAAVLCTLRERIDAAVLDAAGSSLRVVSNYAVGYDNIDVAAATERGILVTNTPGVLTDATADLTWALILAAARRVVEGDRMVRSGAFQGWAPTMLLGADVAGATLGIVGMGQIGRAVARRAAGFSMPVVYTRRSGPLKLEETPAGVEWRYCSDLDDLLREADIISVHVPLTEGTRHLLGARELALVRPGVVLVNTARGPVVHEEALVEALRAGPLGAAGLDVYEDEPAIHPGLVGLENVVLLPHLGSATHAARGRMAELAARNAIAALSGKRVPHPVNPEVLS